MRNLEQRMYFYLYDSFLQDKKYVKVLADIEAKLIDLSIQGRTARLNILNNIKEMITDAVKRGAKTVVVLGDDKTVSKAMHAVVGLGVTLGIVPLGSGPHTLAHHFGIEEGLAACEILSKRVTERVDIGRAGNYFFASHITAQTPGVAIVSEDRKYRMTPINETAELYICNFKPPELNVDAQRAASFFIPKDGSFEVVIKSEKSKSFLNKLFSKEGDTIGDCTILPFKKITIESAAPEIDVRLLLDDDKIVKPPFEIEVLPREVQVVVGKDRKF